ncbi:ATP synthase F1 subunit epsilon [Vallitalea sp.]|jgi:F-type H+-transporting ATPase subunit epsilon|uniref:ATP synthase F1 subunit epsilon n=1 Tax=Vallitalea sp. TaxID=1882829 RepID=UPI0025D4BCCA|nr:ATP synthase F1 subunit epsilon [Vallitalea sp.]MCT4688683.1 ATP synthase F1 subunit epsilon [Vallitalea sp.]
MANNKFLLQVVTPERIFYEDDVERVEFKTSEGDIGVYANHIPLTTPVVSGMMVIKNDSKVEKAAIHKGFVEITPEKVTILTDAAEWPYEIDIKRAEEAKLRAERRLKADKAELNEIRTKAALARSVVRIEVSKYDDSDK